jgi:hypothetical protein
MIFEPTKGSSASSVSLKRRSSLLTITTDVLSTTLLLSNPNEGLNQAMHSVSAQDRGFQRAS